MSEIFLRAQIQNPQSRRTQRSSLPENILAKRICPRQQNKIVSRTQNATRSPFTTTNNPALAVNVPFNPNTPPSSTNQQQNIEPAIPNALPLPDPLFAPNLIAPCPHAPLVNQPPVHNTFQNKTNQVNKVARTVAPPVPNMPNISLGQQFLPNTSHWRSPQQRPSKANQGTTTVNSLPQIVLAHIRIKQKCFTTKKSEFRTFWLTCNHHPA